MNVDSDTPAAQPPAAPPPPPAPPPAPPEPGAGSVWARVRAHLNPFWLLAALVLAAFVVLWLDTRGQVAQLRLELARRLADADTTNRDTHQQAAATREAERQLEYKVGMLDSRLAETQNQRLALEALYLELSRSRDERILSEVEQILLIGSEQLQLAGNVKAALIALESADYRLQRVDSPQFTGVRRALARDMERLKSAPYVDVVGIGLRLDNLAHQVEALPLAMNARPADPNPPQPAPGEPALVRLLRDMWQDLASLVRVQRPGADEVPLLSPSQVYFLRENLRLRLLLARVCLLAHDQTGFRSEARAGAEWLGRYFDVRDKTVGGAQALLRQFAQADIAVDVPDISASLEAVRSQRLVRERGLR